MDWSLPFFVIILTLFCTKIEKIVMKLTLKLHKNRLRFQALKVIIIRTKFYFCFAKK